MKGQCGARLFSDFVLNMNIAICQLGFGGKSPNVGRDVKEIGRYLI